MNQLSDKMSQVIPITQASKELYGKKPLPKTDENDQLYQARPGTRNRFVAELLKQCGYFWEDEE